MEQPRFGNQSFEVVHKTIAINKGFQEDLR
jgi:hypothetical protein